MEATETLPQVCDRCRIKKVGCDGVTPVCGRCNKAGVECTTSARLRRKTKPRSFGNAQDNEVKRLKSQVSDLRDLVQRMETSTQRGSALQNITSVSSPQSIPSPAHHSTGGSSAPGPSRRKLDAGVRDGPIIGHLGRLVSLGHDRHFFAGSTTGVHFIRSVELRWQKLTCTDQAFPDCFFHMHLLPRPTLSLTSDPLLVMSPPGLSLPQPKDYYISRVQHFLSRWTQYFPVLCERQAYHEYGAVIDAMQGSRTIDNVLPILHQLLLVLAIDACDSDESSQDYYRMAEMLGSQAFEGCSVRSVQSHILRAVLLQLLGKHDTIPPSIAAAVRAAQTIGLHRHPRRFKLCAGESELRTRLWWCVSILDITCSITFGLPKLIDEADVDVQSPTECDLTDMSALELPVPLPGESTQITLFIAYVRLSSIMQQFTKRLFTTTERRDGERKIQQLDGQLRVWGYEFSAVRGKHGSISQDTTLEPHLHVMGCFSMLLIHQPGLTFDEHVPQFDKSLAISLQSALAILSTLERSQLDKRLFYLQPNIIRMVFQSALVCLLHAWRHKTDVLASSELALGSSGTPTEERPLSSAIETAVGLLESLVSQSSLTDHDMTTAELNQAIGALRGMSVKTSELYSDASSQHAVGLSIPAMVPDSLLQINEHDLMDTSSSLWDLNDAALFEWWEDYEQGLLGDPSLGT